MRSPETTSWHSASWQTPSRPSSSPSTRTRRALERVVAEISRLPPIVVSWEIEALRAAAGGGAARRGVPAAGRRLRRDFADCESDTHRQEAEDPAADEPRAAARAEEADRPRRAHGRPVRQAALGRHRDARRRDAAELPRRPGQPPGVHRRGARAPTRSCCCAATSAPRSPSTSCARWSTAASPTCTTRSTGTWGSCTTRRCKDAYQRIVELDRRCAGFLRGHERAAGARGDAGGLLRQPRGPAPAVRAGADALHPAPEPLVQPVDAHAVDRHAHRARSTARTSSTSAASPIRSASRSARPWTRPGCRDW